MQYRIKYTHKTKLLFDIVLSYLKIFKKVLSYAYILFDIVYF